MIFFFVFVLFLLVVLRVSKEIHNPTPATKSDNVRLLFDELLAKSWEVRARLQKKGVFFFSFSR